MKKLLLLALLSLSTLVGYSIGYLLVTYYYTEPVDTHSQLIVK